ncbi:TPA: hypothetical protein ACJCQR_001065 [Neisseria meningitidis]|uniref:Uncharacterized protein n=2 Tax=Neisseria lactamica TaxID=486 RepID=D0WCJ2_NEILA|nr:MULTISPECIES: hypothetical protein [Neisseria]EEZ74692.1 hypothetical protein NEILACOT_05275 [Neisseria lactamica ATCC 23970]KFJ35528.1 hypothetical protein DR91_1546 [Neisseria lactamica ATCC 23970]MBH2049659.1 hypothetical protein [Neisseria meningitidis]MBH2083390.1 hypothetical protein [Neisseria meningitidis]MBH2251037.1 hypothetical protein [Neisseria meningitidis]
MPSETPYAAIRPVDESALTLMHILKHELPDTLVIGISHQNEIKNLFERKINLTACHPSE